jgi:glycosyltransferase involved in cell wall biosynthesis
MDELLISLVICTMGREAETARCIRSIIEQNYSRIQVVVVDQSPDNRMVPYIEELRRVASAEHVRCSRLGAAAARNFGMRHTVGEVVTFPDDDSWYTEGVLSYVNDLLTQDPSLDGVTGRTVQEDSSQGNGRFATAAGWVTRHNVWTTSIEFTIFLRRTVVLRVGDFDELIGTGAPTRLQAGEGTDYIIRCIGLGHRIWYSPDLKVGHPRPRLDARRVKKFCQYGLGMGYVARTHRLPFFRETAALLYRPFGGVIISLCKGNVSAASVHAATGIGRSWGYLRGRSLRRPVSGADALSGSLEVASSRPPRS